MIEIIRPNFKITTFQVSPLEPSKQLPTYDA